jgi:hypothetical protein
MRPISDAELDEVKELVASGRAMPALVVASILARLEEAEGRPDVRSLTLLGEPFKPADVYVALTPINPSG